ncbi:MAG: hypothetical protein EOP48_25400, partial [Sphingobacteriales bacterium]
MNKLRRIVAVLVLSGFFGSVSAQDKPAYWSVSLNKGIGFEWNTVDFQQVITSGNKTLMYSPGGGLGLRLGLGKYITKRLSTDIYTGYQQILAFSYENNSGETNKSYGSFSYITVGATVNLTVLKFEKSAFEEIQLLGGGYWNVPGSIKEEENEKTLNNTSYNNSFGWLAGVKSVLNLGSASSKLR